MFPFADTCWFLSGPTAGGKTAVGLELARRIDAEIISLDSMAVYRGMDIGTAKPTAVERAVVPHHLIDLVEPHEEYSVARYLADAAKAAWQIQERGKKALFVGGTPLYLKALLRGIAEGPPADWPLRRELQNLAREQGLEALHRRLAEVDPVAAEKLPMQDERRIIRALEVFAKTGKPISQWQAQFSQGNASQARHVYVLNWPREELYERINRRVDAMFAAGLVEEVQSLVHNLAEQGRHFSRTASQAVGYREVLEHLSGARDLTATIELVKMRTRQFAKRQLTWLRSLSECQFVPVS